MMFSIKPAGEPPSPRAAHAAAAVGTMVVFQVIVGVNFSEIHFLLAWPCWDFDGVLKT